MDFCTRKTIDTPLFIVDFLIRYGGVVRQEPTNATKNFWYKNR